MASISTPPVVDQDEKPKSRRPKGKRNGCFFHFTFSIFLFWLLCQLVVSPKASVVSRLYRKTYHRSSSDVAMKLWDNEYIFFSKTTEEFIAFYSVFLPTKSVVIEFLNILLLNVVFLIWTGNTKFNVHWFSSQLDFIELWVDWWLGQPLWYIYSTDKHLCINCDNYCNSTILMFMINFAETFFYRHKI